MLATYAVTLICSIFPCTQIIHTTTSLQFGVPYTVEPVQTSPSTLVFVPGNIPWNGHGYNWSSVIQIESEYIPHEDADLHVDPHAHLLLPAGDQPIEDFGGHGVAPAPSPFEMQNDNNNNLDVDNSNPIVYIKDGGLKGFTMKTITNRSFSAFQSIPFAKPPLGPYRFKAPEKNSPWKGVRDAIAESPTCIQADYIQRYKIHGQEDCLYMAVYTPQLPKSRQSRKAEPLPVMVWIHGGGWFFSSSSLYGPSYLLDQDIVLVTLNYRLSMFGFLSTGDEASPGNNGLKDQSLAMRWVKENIAAFGGDPNRITIFGESAGAGSVHLHMVSPLSKGLFHGAISQSGCATCFWSISEKAVEVTRKYASFLNCSGTSEELLTCLRGIDANTLVGTQLYLLEWLMFPVVIFGPVLEPSLPGAFLDELPENVYKRNAAANVPWISGFNNDEGAINIATLFLDNKTAPELNNEWDKYGQIFLDLKNSENNSVEIAQKVKNYYMGDDSIVFENRDRAIKMFSDRYVIACGVKGIKMHAQYGQQPVYAYNLGYKGKYSTVQLLGQKTEDWGVSHLDDLIYLFNNTAYYSTLSVEDEEYQMSKIMTSLWTNFAATGKPLLTGTNNELQNIWVPVSKTVTLDSPVEYLNIDLSPKMVHDPYYERVKFWRQLRLQDE